MNKQERIDLEYAAKAAGLQFDPTVKHPIGLRIPLDKDQAIQILWNPRTYDGDAFRLMVELELTVIPGIARDAEGRLYIGKSDDPAAATREAIFQAAVAIGQAMP